MDAAVITQMHFGLLLGFITVVYSESNYTAPCNLNLDSYCSIPGPHYPWDNIGIFIKGNLGTTKRLFGDPKKKMLSFRRDDFGYNPCPSIMEAAQPYWARNIDGKLRAIINYEPFTQFIQVERCYDAFTGLPNKCDTDCGCYQDYRLQRLLVSDPHSENGGIFMDWFNLPFCCMCKCSLNNFINTTDTSEDFLTPKVSNNSNINGTENMDPLESDAIDPTLQDSSEVNVTTFESNISSTAKPQVKWNHTHLHSNNSQRVHFYYTKKQNITFKKKKRNKNND